MHIVFNVESNLGITTLKVIKALLRWIHLPCNKFGFTSGAITHDYVEYTCRATILAPRLEPLRTKLRLCGFLGLLSSDNESVRAETDLFGKLSLIIAIKHARRYYISPRYIQIFDLPLGDDDRWGSRNRWHSELRRQGPPRIPSSPACAPLLTVQ
jgi:hypothetical protein